MRFKMPLRLGPPRLLSLVLCLGGLGMVSSPSHASQSGAGAIPSQVAVAPQV
eukprot:CAMPEP_0195316294 /NCGR_PEP_ID=MMETSP0708-20121125/3514_1 /TAXON_ID=33640 /ORGANISM="Asterionellopsis glacialis, Strain CCMP134" /LENGTH=51 /DNA_ID=CAMNT_0040381669 /DNA_START=52 /DNA_END=204 /DNA_ORIENTATION=-